LALILSSERHVLKLSAIATHEDPEGPSML